jgi:hypothetical protein
VLCRGAGIAADARRELTRINAAPPRQAKTPGLNRTPGIAMSSRQTSANQRRRTALQRARLPVAASLAAALGVCAAPALGQPQVFCPDCESFTFSIGPLQGRDYINNHDGTQTAYDTGLYTLGGSFRAFDADGDGHIRTAELVEFRFGGLDFPDSVFGPGAFGPTRIDSFDYSSTSGLSVSAHNGRFSLVTGSSYSYHSPAGGSIFSWRPDTVTAVPEPASWLGLTAGLAGLAALAPGRRRRRATGASSS